MQEEEELAKDVSKKEKERIKIDRSEKLIAQNAIKLH